MNTPNAFLLFLWHSKDLSAQDRGLAKAALVAAEMGLWVLFLGWMHRTANRLAPLVGADRARV